MNKILLFLILFTIYSANAQSDAELKCFALARVIDADGELLNANEKPGGISNLFFKYKDDYYIEFVWQNSISFSYTILKVPNITYWNFYNDEYDKNGAQKAIAKYIHYEVCTFNLKK